ncbi:type II toxin-antitoxin system VapC family toxin [Conexibacter stalactiti]|uniref:Type II toxin-antitoxin system VapC family toxin n=1 Tax=Conexibacter stalactiti TaxID=1940611 RepID=A0ABU4HTK8_9ACTN|nr:type II toxin-antitoxin system VapC family toxin [Conexibacter stalactiti]MDW5596657.1 type II toxin-antitoxin system VapC family toxin [Conexibacter stalactiti]MEC5037299.1 type II toxin-antitoxin system VapC family toxin [Conexibacter stalactiti]
MRWLDAQEWSDLVITSVTVAEILYGIARLDDGRRKRELAEALERFVDELVHGRALSLDVDTAPHGELRAARERAGRPIDPPDAQIAAICRLHGASLATRNGRDFEGTGVSLLDPWRLG